MKNIGVSFDSKRNVYRIRIIREGITLVNKTCRTKSEATNLAKLILDDYERNKRDGINFALANTTFGECFDNMLKNQVIDGKEIPESNSCRFKEGTIDNYKQMYRNYLTKLKDVKMIRLNPGLIDEVLNVIPTKNKDNKNSSVPRRCKAIITKVILYAEKYNIVHNFPRTYGENIVKKEISYQECENDYLSYDQAISIFNYLSNHREPISCFITNDDILFIFQLLYYSGVRIGEARALKVSDFKIDAYGKAYISIERQKDDKTGNITSLKGHHEERIVYLKKEVHNSFKQFFKSKKYEEDTYVLDINGTGVINRQLISRILKKTVVFLKSINALDKNTYENLSPQSMRISNNIYFIDILGLSLDACAKMQGHTKSTYHKYYKRVTDDFNQIF